MSNIFIRVTNLPMRRIDRHSRPTIMSLLSSPPYLWNGRHPSNRSLTTIYVNLQEEDESIDADNLSAGEVRRRLEKYRKKERLEQHRKAMEKVHICFSLDDRCIGWMDFL